MAALGDTDQGGRGLAANPSGGGDASATDPSAPSAPTSPPQPMLTTEGYMVGSPLVFPHCQHCAACPLAPQYYPAPTPVPDTMTCSCWCQTGPGVAFAIVRYFDTFLRLLGTDGARRTLAIFFSFLTVVFVLVASGTEIPACRYLLSTGIIANVYSLVQFTAVWNIASSGSLPRWLSDDVFLYATFTCDLVLSYLLLSSSSVAVLGVNNSRWYYYDSHQNLARCSIAWSFATFFFTAMSSVLSGYKLYERILVFLPSASSGNKLGDANESTVEMAPPDHDHADAGDGGVADPGCDVSGAGVDGDRAPTVQTAVHVWSLPPSASRLLQYGHTTYPCQLRTTFAAPSPYSAASALLSLCWHGGCWV